jgi:hypothetical protein
MDLAVPDRDFGARSLSHVLRLQFADTGERAPDVPASGVHVWHNRQGEVVAYGFERDGFRWMHWPAVATFRFASTDPHIAAFPEGTGSTSVIWDIYRRTVLPMALQASGLEALHASAIAAPSGVVAFCATSETGKSTVAYGLHCRGFPQWSDDGVVFRADVSGPTALPLPFEVRLRPGSRKMFGAMAPSPTRFAGNGPGDQVHVAPAPLSAVYLLARVDAASLASPARIRQVPPAEAFRAVLAHAHVFDPFDNARREQMLHAYLDLVAHVPVVEVSFAPVSENFVGLLDAIGEALGRESPIADHSRCMS